MMTASLTCPMTMDKLKAGIFDGPQTRQLIRDLEFEKSLNEVELEAWKEISRQQEGQKLCKTCQKHADGFQKPELQHEPQDALSIFP